MKRTLIGPAYQAYAVSDMNLILLDFISGMSIGIEFFTGEDLDPEDVFAMQVDLLIIRITFVRKRA